MRTHRDILDLFPKDDLAVELGLSPHTIKAWQQRDHIPDGYWLPLIAVAVGRGMQSVTLLALAWARTQKLKVLAPRRTAAAKKGVAAKRAATVARAVA